MNTVGWPNGQMAGDGCRQHGDPVFLQYACFKSPGASREKPRKKDHETPGFSMWFLVFLSRLVPKHGRPVTQKEGVAQVSVDVSAPSGDGQEIQALKVGTPIGEAREVTVQVNSLVFYFRGCYRCRAVCAVMQVAAGIGFFERSADNPRNLPPLHRKE